MQYTKYRPSASLSQYIECFFLWCNHDATTTIQIETPPTSYAAIVINLLDPISFGDSHGFSTLPKAYLSGQADRHYTLCSQGKFEQIGIVFKPTAIFHLFNLPLIDFTNTRIDLRDLDLHLFDQIAEKLWEIKETSGRIDLLESILLTLVAQRKNELDGVDFAAEKILAYRGNTSISELIEQSFMSRRKFERHFLNRIGFSPKYFASIRRYGYVCSLMAGKRAVTWSELLYQGGYYDQSHFIKDFKRFSQRSPVEYLSKNQELAHFVKPTVIEN